MAVREKLREAAHVFDGRVHVVRPAGREAIAGRIEQYEKLVELGCEFAQGYYFAKPASQAAVEHQLSGERDDQSSVYA